MYELSSSNSNRPWSNIAIVLLLLITCPVTRAFAGEDDPAPQASRLQWEQVEATGPESRSVTSDMVVLGPRFSCAPVGCGDNTILCRSADFPNSPLLVDDPPSDVSRGPNVIRFYMVFLVLAGLPDMLPPNVKLRPASQPHGGAMSTILNGRTVGLTPISFSKPGFIVEALNVLWRDGSSLRQVTCTSVSMEASDKSNSAKEALKAAALDFASSLH